MNSIYLNLWKQVRFTSNPRLKLCNLWPTKFPSTVNFGLKSYQRELRLSTSRRWHWIREPRRLHPAASWLVDVGSQDPQTQFLRLGFLWKKRQRIWILISQIFFCSTTFKTIFKIIFNLHLSNILILKQ